MNRMSQKTRVVNMRNYRGECVYIGRAGQGYDGYFGNPVILRRESDRDKVLSEYADYFFARMEADPEFAARIHALKGQVLACFCKPRRCHGDVIAAYLDLDEPDEEDDDEHWLERIPDTE